MLAIDKDFVDNTYGTNAIGWPGGHSFGNLTGSDHAQFYGYDANGAKVLDFKLDYLTSSSGTPSGYASLGVTGGEGRMNLGSAASIQAWGTSLDYSLNKTGYCAGGDLPGHHLSVNSPATDAFYTPNPTYPDWIYDVIYEVKIAKSAFGAAGFGSLEVPYIHASPSKIGTNTIYATPGACPGEIGDTVWNDQNANAVQDAARRASTACRSSSTRTTATAFQRGDRCAGRHADHRNGGQYLFQDLTANDYFVDVVNETTVPAGYQITTYNDPTPVISLGEGQSYLDADFGYRAAPSGGSIGDFVWNDANKNGIQDAGEAGIPGVTVRLYDGANNLLATTTTSGTGYYVFANRPAGNYQVEFQAPSGSSFSNPNQGSDPAKDSDANPVTGRTVVFYVATNATDLTWDAGLLVPVPVCVTLQPDEAGGLDAYIKQENVNENKDDR